MASESIDVESAVSSLNLLFNGHLVTYSITLACRLNIAGILAEAGKPLSIHEIVERIPGEVNLSYLKRIIRLLCVFGIFEEALIEEAGRYSLTSLSQLLRSDIKDRSSLKNEIEQTADPSSIKAWAVLEDCVRSKKQKIPYNEGLVDTPCDHKNAPQAESADVCPHKHEEHSDEHSHEDEHDHFESFHEIFILMKYYGYGFAELEKRKAHIMDLGGHKGTTLAVIKKNFPNLRCTSLDLSDTVCKIEQKPDGVEIAAGDYFKPETLPKCDVVLLKHIAHMYPDQDKCIELLQNCLKVLPASGIIILCECVLPNIGKIDVNNDNCKRALMADISMLSFGVGARTMDEFLAVFDAARLKIREFIETTDAMTQIFILEKV